MNFDQIDRLLVDALPWLSVTVFPVLLILAVVFGFELYRLGDENVHDVDDYKPAPDVPPVVRERRRLRPEPSLTPIHDALTREPMPEVVARRIARQWLEEIAAEQQAKAGIRPRSTHWRSDSGECWIGCPICDRDMTGAFPVVRAA